jgi:hypothetical protein
MGKLTWTTASSGQSGRRRSRLVGTRASRLDSFKANEEDDKVDLLDTSLELAGLVWHGFGDSIWAKRESGCLAEVRVRHERRQHLETVVG